jgi:hypothetical protein
MKISIKITIALLIIAIALIVVWLSLGPNNRCKLIYGKNICNFYEMMDTVSTDPESSDFEKAMRLCREMSNVPKKDSCFEYIAQVVSLTNIEKAKEACNEIEGFNDVHDKESCYNRIQRPIKERLIEAILEEYNQTRTPEQRKEIIEKINTLFGEDLEITFKEAKTRYYSYGIPNPAVITDFVQLKVIEIYEDNKGFTTEVDAETNEILKRWKDCTTETRWITLDQAKEIAKALLAKIVNDPENYELLGEDAGKRTYFTLWRKVHEGEFYSKIPGGEKRQYLSRAEDRYITICTLNGELISYEYHFALAEEEVEEMAKRWEETQSKDVKAIREILGDPNAKLTFVNWVSYSRETKQIELKEGVMTMPVEMTSYRVYRDENGYCYDIDDEGNIYPDTETLRTCKTPQL